MFDKKTRKTKQLMDECNTMSRDSFAIVNVLTHFVWLASLSRESLPQIICLLDPFLFEWRFVLYKKFPTILISIYILIKFLGLCVTIFSESKKKENTDHVSKLRMEGIDACLKMKTYLYSEYANNIDNCTAVATKNAVKLRQLTFGHPVWACGVETLSKQRKKRKIQV